MPISDLRDRLAGLLSRRSSTSPAGEPKSEIQTRQDRASHVATLRSDVSRLQTEIADLSRPTAAEIASGTSSIDIVRVTQLQNELEGKQRELSKFQARI